MRSLVIAAAAHPVVGVVIRREAFHRGGWHLHLGYRRDIDLRNAAECKQQGDQETKQATLAVGSHAQRLPRCGAAGNTKR